MANFTRNFLSGRMNKVVDQRVLPEGEYVDAMNIRMGSTENSEVGVITNTKGNLPLTSLAYLDGTPLSINARCIGAIEDSANETIYWFVHDPEFTVGATGKLDLVVSYNVLTNILTYHVISIDDGGGVDTTLNFNPSYLITGVNLINDLLFWTDDYNAPRFINIRPIGNRYPNPIANVDVLNPEAILVIKKPPIEAPTVQPITTSGQENYLETRFVCFAYRYKYIDGEYSATSQWSAPAFVPNQFSFSLSSMLNEGMTNYCNTAIINFNSGGPLVVGIDLLFKQSENNIIKIIQQFNKVESAYADDNVYQYSFNNSKIFTILNEAEILRLYDNVPRYAKAQTIMGNRLMFGNYIEGYDLIDKNGQPTKIEYFTDFITEVIGSTDVEDSLGTGVYNIDPMSTGLSINDCTVYFDLAGQNLVEGAAISLDVKIAHSLFTGYTPFPDQETENIDLSFGFLLTTSYASVYELATSPEFQSAVGTALNILPVSTTVIGEDTSCSGVTFTDSFNCALPNNLGTSPNDFTKYGSGINAILQPVKIITTPASTSIGFQFPAMEYVDDITIPTKRVYEYYEVIYANAAFQEIASPQSLHSNRGYEIGIVYMDEFNRSTTALVSTNNAEHIPCGYSANKNSIQVTIPSTQIAPEWATRYKFVIKPDAERYETIFSNLYFINPETNDAWLLLEGENMRKVENGDKLIVKADTIGPTPNCVYTTVLEKTSQTEGFIKIPSVLDPDVNINVPAGLYMKLNPNNFNLVIDENAIIAAGKKGDYASDGHHAFLSYPMNIEGTDPSNPTWTFVDYDIPAGSRIEWYVDWNRPGVKRKCEPRGYRLDKVYTSSSDYDNMYDWFVGDNIALTINSGTDKGDGEINEFVPGTSTYLVDSDDNINYWQFYRNPTTNELIIRWSSTNSCTGGRVNYPRSRRIYIEADITVFRAESTIVFETQPADSLPDVFFENELSFAIDADGNHSGNIQDQDIASNVPAIIDTKFFNCFAFGNGVESYKIRDSIIGRSFSFGERVTTVAAENYMAADRFSDITYSGIYNGESNINKLNEFNSGLSNFKHCEASFGEIQLLDGRNTDILTLQEDKISYVLGDKNLLSDASAGGIITASPAVLGTQMARTEKYGISFNPESYVQWGFDRFFTDAKRGAVIQLKGGDSQNEQLVAISEQNMRTWFRDKFNDSFNYQKLGGFDPYMNEYVLVMNDQSLPINPQCLACGTSQTFTLSVIAPEVLKTHSYCVDLGPTVGTTEVSWVFSSIELGKTLTVKVNYNGDLYTSGPVSTDGNLFFNKNNISVETAEITLEYTGDMVVSVLGDCCNADEMSIIEVVLTNNSESGDTIHTQYRYTNDIFVGPLLSNLVFFGSGTASPLVSRYNITTGFVGSGGFPPELSNMRLSTNQISPDNYVFNIAQDKFRYLRTSTLYNNNNVDMNAMLAASTIATPNAGVAPLYYADFVVPLSSLGQFLYLIWDLRDAVPLELCYNASAFPNPCCDCTSSTYYLNASFTSATSIYTDVNLTTFAPNGFYSSAGIVRELVGGILLPQQTCSPCAVEASLCFGTDAADVCCNCDTSCATPYNTYAITNSGDTPATIGFYNQNGIYQESIIDAYMYDIFYCSIGTPVCSAPMVSIAFFSCGCGSCLDCVPGAEITIGTQLWTNCNLDVTTYSNGDPIPEVTDATAWNALTTGAWCYYNNDPSNGATYGKLYNGYAVNDPRGLAPIGYHIPTDAEWTTLTTFLGGTSVAGGKMKEIELCHWLTPNTDATNSSGFAALPGGCRGDFGVFKHLGTNGDWWSSTEDGLGFNIIRYLGYYDGASNSGSYVPYYGFSIRLIKDEI